MEARRKIDVAHSYGYKNVSTITLMFPGESSPYAEALSWVFGLSSLAYLVLALIFPFRIKINRIGRLIPLAVFLGSFLIPILFPITGFTDLRTVWRIFAGDALYSLCYLAVAVWLFFLRTSFSQWFSLVSVLTGLSAMAMNVWGALESLRHF